MFTRVCFTGTCNQYLRVQQRQRTGLVYLDVRGCSNLNRAMARPLSKYSRDGSDEADDGGLCLYEYMELGGGVPPLY